MLMSGDPKEELGSLYLRLRHAVVHDGATLIELTPNETSLSRYAQHSIRVRPGDIGVVADAVVNNKSEADIGSVTGQEIAGAFAALVEAESVSIIYGRTSLADHASLTIEALAAFASSAKTRFLPALRRGNIGGAMDLGLVPGMLPGRTTLEAGRTAITDTWRSTPASMGMTTAEMLQAAAAGDMAVLILLGADPLTDFGDPALAQAGLEGADLVIAVDPFINASSAHAADIVLPAAAFGEIDGSHTNLEGRITPIRQKVTSPGTARADWMIAAELASRMHFDLGFDSVTDITDEIASVSPLHAEATAATIEAAADGVLLSGAPVGSLARTALSPAPSFDSYSFRLVIDRTMYDAGTQTAMCPSIADQATAGAVRINSTEAAKLGVSDGSSVRLSSERASIEGSIIVDDRIANGVAAVAHNHDGLDARPLVDRAAPVTDIRIETV